jgi:monoamine oxidase
MARTPLFGAVRRAIGGPIGRATRREVLRGMAAGAALACSGVPRGKAQPRVAIVGAGAAGLGAASELARLGIDATVYEASRRVGGRIVSAGDLVPGAVVELGAEFIDSTHAELLALARDLGLELIDLRAAAEQKVAPSYFFDGTHHSEEELVGALKPLAPRIQEDLAGVSPEVGWNNEGGAAALDGATMAAYFDRIGVGQGWLRELLDVAFVGEFGLETTEQSALNFLFLYSAETGLYGTSDERWKIRGGNQRIVEGLARRLEGRIETGRRLVALSARGAAYRLAFEGGVEVDADVVILTLPFTLLREVDLRFEMPPVKRKVIDELGYGMNTKVIVGVKERIWRANQHSGGLFTDQPFEASWDATRGQRGDAGALTLFLGGTTAVDAGNGSASSQWQRFAPGVEAAFPGFGAVTTGAVHRFHWPSQRFARCSYTCYRPGQWTTLHGAEGLPVGRILFAGEHCSDEFSGYMQGALETGLRAARDVAKLAR